MQAKPILLYDDECSVCRRIGAQVQRSAQTENGEVTIIALPIGDDPERLRTLSPGLNIWDAYATVHVLMPDGSMKLGGEAVAEVLRRLPRTRGLARIFSITIFGGRPFQALLNVAYAFLDDVRPILGCESCGSPSPVLRPIHWLTQLARTGHVARGPHFSLRSSSGQVAAAAAKSLQPQSR